MTSVSDGEWVRQHTAGAPARLRRQVEAYFDAEPSGGLSDRLATAGDAALHAATSAGSTRAAAIDLLAADALITLALLVAAERAPATLADVAAELRQRAATAE
jgi:hypothetical protein